jgi:hypothetical protein
MVFKIQRFKMKKWFNFNKFISLFMCISLLFANLAYARPKPIDLSEHTPLNSGLRSLVLPGWGQFFNSQKTKGYIVSCGTGLLVISSYLLYVRANNTYDDYEKIGAVNGSIYSDYETQSQDAMIVSFVAAGAWIYGVVDAYLTAKNTSHRSAKIENTVKINCSSDGIKLVYQKKF